MGGGDGAGNRGLTLLSGVLDALTGEVSGTTLGGLEDNRGLLVASGLEGSDDSRRRGDVASGKGVAVGASVLEKLQDVIA